MSVLRRSLLVVSLLRRSLLGRRLRGGSLGRPRRKAVRRALMLTSGTRGWPRTTRAGWVLLIVHRGPLWGNTAAEWTSAAASWFRTYCAWRSYRTYPGRVIALWWFPSAVVATTLVIAGLAKLVGPPEMRDPRTTAAAMALPQHTPSLVAIRAHPWVEVAVGLGVLLLPSRAVLIPAVLALTLCLTYTALTFRAVRAGSTQCRCFGMLGTGTLSGWTTLRNVALSLGAIPGVVMAAHGTTLISSGRGWVAAAGVGVTAVVLIVPLVTGARQQGVRAAIDEAPRLTMMELHLSTDCGPCGYLRRRVGELRAEGELPVTVVEAGPGEPAPRGVLQDASGATMAIYDDPWDIETTLRILATPSPPAARGADG